MAFFYRRFCIRLRGTKRRFFKSTDPTDQTEKDVLNFAFKTSFFIYCRVYILSQVFEPNSAISNENIRGIEITQSVCDISVIEAPVLGSPPYASGNTMVFNPRGAA